ncbi:MAG: aldo/keto reductase [bacterium]
MKRSPKQPHDRQAVSRRRFLVAGSGLVAGGSLALTGNRVLAEDQNEIEPARPPLHLRTLGRTGWQATDISLGCIRISDANVVRYAYDAGINYFDTAEVYGNGQSETLIGEAMQHMDRKKIFITSKLRISDEDTDLTIRDRFNQCLSRLQTDYIDCLCMHSVKEIAWKDHPAFHAAMNALKADGKLRFIGITSHGPDSDEQDSMEQVLCAAAEDGRWDLMLLVYGFLNQEAGENVLAACKAKNVGTSAMKYAPGRLEVPLWDPENPSPDFQASIERIMGRGETRETAIQRIQDWVDEQTRNVADMQPFLEEHGIESVEQLRAKSIQWVLQNRDMHTVCVTMNSFEELDTYLALSGTDLSQTDQGWLRDYGRLLERQYCRHACQSCLGACPNGLPVSKIMRYAYYFSGQGREKYAMQKYARLRGENGAACLTCSAPCTAACPHEVNVPAQMFAAHSLLSLV